MKVERLYLNTDTPAMSTPRIISDSKDTEASLGGLGAGGAADAHSGSWLLHWG